MDRRSLLKSLAGAVVACAWPWKARAAPSVAEMNERDVEAMRKKAAEQHLPLSDIALYFHRQNRLFRAGRIHGYTTESPSMSFEAFTSGDRWLLERERELACTASGQYLGKSGRIG